MGKMLAVEKKPENDWGTPGNIVAIRPLRQGVIADYSTTEIMLKYF